MIKTRLNHRRSLAASIRVQPGAAANVGPAFLLPQPTLLPFPIGISPRSVDAAVRLPPRSGAAGLVEVEAAKVVQQIGANCSLLFARPHPYLDASRFQPKYRRIPGWLSQGTEVLCDNALAVIATFPPDVPAITSHFLPALGFTGPFIVIPVLAELGTDVPHSHVTVLARRPVPPPPPEYFRRARGESLFPHILARRLIPVAEHGLQLFAPYTPARHDPIDALAASWLRIRGVSNWKRRRE